MPEEEHPVARLAGEAKGTTRAVADFFNSTEKNYGPHEDGDWPRDLTRDELARLMPQLRETIQNLADAIELVLDRDNLATNHADAGRAERVAEGLRLVTQGAEAIRAGEGLFGTAPGQPAPRAQQELAAENFPRGPAAGPRPSGGPAQPAAPSPHSAARQQPGQGRARGHR
jgi:hypothetical protein